jgi:hypothetical protein
MASERYRNRVEDIYASHAREVEDIVRQKSFYLLRRLPKDVAARLLAPALPDLLAKRKKDGLWNRSERITYDILSAVKYAGLGESNEEALAATLADSEDFYALLIKRDILGAVNERDRAAIRDLIARKKGAQNADGSWEDTVVGTVVHLEALLDLGVDPRDRAIRRGTEFLFENLNGNLQGIHTKDTYALVGHDIFTTADRKAEFEAAQRLKPEWIPRNVCFRTLAMLPNAACLILLVRLGLENDPRVARALDCVYGLFKTYGGLCATYIKKPFL